MGPTRGSPLRPDGHIVAVEGILRSVFAAGMGQRAHAAAPAARRKRSFTERPAEGGVAEKSVDKQTEEGSMHPCREFSLWIVRNLPVFGRTTSCPCRIRHRGRMPFVRASARSGFPCYLRPPSAEGSAEGSLFQNVRSRGRRAPERPRTGSRGPGWSTPPDSQERNAKGSSVVSLRRSHRLSKTPWRAREGRSPLEQPSSPAA